MRSELHRFGSALHMHQDDWRLALCSKSEELRIIAAGGDVVDHIEAGIQCRLSNG